jgi:triacylglycerol esterase/lipase EstA (alpha/beta hydrolase family)
MAYNTMLICTGYQIIQGVINEGQEDETPVITVHGHVHNGVDEITPLPDYIKNLRLPGTSGWKVVSSRRWVKDVMTSGVDRRTAPSLS